MELEDDSDIPNIRESKVYLRIFSRDTNQSENNSPYKILQIPQWKYSFKSVEFIFKLIELTIAVLCIGFCSTEGLYEDDIINLLVARNRVSAIIFPNVVFGSYIITLSVIIFSYVLGYPMPDILVRIFNVIAVITYLASMGVCVFLFTLIKDLDENIYENIKTTEGMVLTVIVLCAINSLLHAFDVYWNIKRIFEDIHSTNNQESKVECTYKL